MDVHPATVRKALNLLKDEGLVTVLGKKKGANLWAIPRQSEKHHERELDPPLDPALAMSAAQAVELLDESPEIKIPGSDAEVDAMYALADYFPKLDYVARRRVIEWANSRWDLNIKLL